MKREYRKWEIRPPKGPFLTIKFSRAVPEELARKFARQLLGTGNLPDRTRVEPAKEADEPSEEDDNAPAGRLGSYTGDGEA